jgi:type I restriction enzyme, S subunit
MTSQPPKNIAASVHQRLLNRSRASGEDFQFLLQRYAAERFLYRLGQSTQRARYVLKGAMLFALWGGSSYRPTRDLDFTGYGSNKPDDVLAAMREICAFAAPDDGLAFDTTPLSAEPIRDDAEYHGLRVKFQATLGSARIPMQIDIGFGNAIEPPARETDYPTLFDAPAPRILAYPHEAVVAEKLHAMVMLGERNSRYKDFYDLHVLARQFPFDGDRLALAVAATFARRQTRIDAALPAALTPRFFAADARAVQWRAYLTRNALPGAPADFAAVGELLQSFLGPIWRALAADRSFADPWPAGGPWSAASFADEVAPGRLTAEMADQAQDSEPAKGVRRSNPYPAYKDSGVEWLGEIPAHWEVMRATWLFSIGSGTTPRAEDPAYYGGETPWVTTSELRESVVFSTEKNVTEEALRDHSSLKVHPTGSIVVAMYGATIGRVGILGVPAAVNQACCVFSNARGIEMQFWFYWLQMRRPHLVSLGYGGGQPNLSQELLSSIRIPTPPLSEQRAIAAFLDRETAKIDALVAKNERLIELLHEERTALITRAVTRGLDPTVPMEDSGVEWLGEIPARWEVKRLRHLSPSLSVGVVVNPSIYLADEGLPFLYGGDISEGRIHAEQSRRISPQDSMCLPKSQLRPDDLVMVRVGAPGVTAVVPPELDGANCASVLVIRRHPTWDSTWLCYALNSRYVRSQVEIVQYGAAQEQFNVSHAVNFAVAVPPLTEQRAIAAFLDQETARIDALIAKVRDVIDRLKEYRAALISAAVTGKIDVRKEIA